jgi:hypothetical protein
MSLAENVETLPQLRGDNYEVARFNALRHGVLSRHTVLPWEDGEEYRSLLEAFVAEHNPRGPTEEHLVEELAGIIWRKRRLRLGENAAHHRALMSASDPYQQTAKAALIGVAEDVKLDSIDDAIRATEQQTPEDRADLEDDQAMTEEALRILASPSSSALFPRAGRVARRQPGVVGGAAQLECGRLRGRPDTLRRRCREPQALRGSRNIAVVREASPRARVSPPNPRSGIWRSRRSPPARTPCPLRGSSRSKARTHARDAVQAERIASRRDPDLKSVS